MPSDDWRCHPLQAGEIAIRQMAGQQEGMVSRSQLLRRDFSRHQIDGRIARGVLTVKLPGVFAFGHEGMYPRRWWHAALLACDPDEDGLTHGTAGAAWDIARGSLLEITTNSGRGRDLDRITPHRRALPEGAIVVHDGLRVTSVAQTILDLAATRGADAAGRAIGEAEIRELYDHRQIEPLLRGQEGSPALREALANFREGPPPDAGIEDWFERFVREGRHEPPAIHADVWVGHRFVQVDFLWRKQRLAVETDGHNVHARRASWNADADKNADLELAGFRVARFTWRQVTRERARQHARLNLLLGEGP